MAVRAGEADVLMQPGPACSDCGACSEAAGGARLLEGVNDPFGVDVGDRVQIEIPAGARRLARWVIFVLPVSALMVGYLAGFLLGSTIGIAPDTLGAVTALACGVLSFIGIRTFETRAGAVLRYTVRVHAIIAAARGPVGDRTVIPSTYPPTEEDTERE
ncbi:MAG: SoxR reducing system RseC family protein [Actinomycetota bacterium]|nr:SoxR reducing system RseC family protein [Actinomycetota bacterium]MDZ4178397.1 SoxR reducing system RseC family protein [Coriobacteriia bacterium]